MAWFLPAIAAVATLVGLNEKKRQERGIRDIAQDAASSAQQERERLEKMYGMSLGEKEREQRLFGIREGEEKIGLTGGLEADIQAELERRTGLSGEELLREIGPETSQLMDIIYGRAGKTGEELLTSEGGVSEALYNQVLTETKDPYAYFESTLAPELELVRQQINAEANKRGVFGGTPEGGIRFEQLGRAGVELAVKSAQAKMAQRQQALSNASILANQAIELAKQARGEATTLSEGARGEKQQARTELENFLTNLQSLYAGTKAREQKTGLYGSEVAMSGQAARNQLLSDLAGVKYGEGSELMNVGLSTLGDVITGGMKIPAPTKNVNPNLGVFDTSGSYQPPLSTSVKTQSIYGQETNPYEDLLRLKTRSGAL